MAFFGVFKNGSLIYLTDHYGKATTQYKLLEADQLQRVESLGQLTEVLAEIKAKQEKPKQQMLDDEQLEAFAENMSDAAESVVSRLEEMGFNAENAERMRESGKQIAADVKSLGIRGLTALNEQIKLFSSKLDETIGSQDESSDEDESPGKDDV